MGDVALNFLYQTVLQPSVILTVNLRVVATSREDIVEIQQNIVPVRIVQTTGVYTRTGENQRVKRNGGMMGNVAYIPLSQMVLQHSVILTARPGVVMTAGMESVETQQNIVFVNTVQTTTSGGNLGALRGGDETNSVAVIFLFLTAHLLSVILLGIDHAAI